MAEIRKNHRYFIQDVNNFLVKVEINVGKFEDCFLNNISLNGACIIVEKEVFLQRQKLYSFQLFEKQEKGNMVEFAKTLGKMVWYLPKEFRAKEMLFLGIEFQKAIEIPKSISENDKVSS